MNDICKSCGCELKVVGSSYRIEGDKNSGEETKLFSVVKVMCINPACPDRKKISEIKNELNAEIFLDNK